MTKYWVEWEMSKTDARSEVVEADDTLDAIAKVKDGRKLIGTWKPHCTNHRCLECCSSKCRHQA